MQQLLDIIEVPFCLSSLRRTDITSTSRTQKLIHRFQLSQPYPHHCLPQEGTASGFLLSFSVFFFPCVVGSTHAHWWIFFVVVAYLSTSQTLFPLFPPHGVPPRSPSTSSLRVHPPPVIPLPPQTVMQSCISCLQD